MHLLETADRENMRTAKPRYALLTEAKDITTSIRSIIDFGAEKVCARFTFSPTIARSKGQRSLHIYGGLPVPCSFVTVASITLGAVEQLGPRGYITFPAERRSVCGEEGRRHWDRPWPSDIIFCRSIYGILNL